jgi:hypothetical protein
MRKALIYTLIAMMPLIYIRDGGVKNTASNTINFTNNEKSVLDLRNKYRKSNWEKYSNRDVLQIERDTLQSKIDIFDKSNLNIKNAFLDSYIKANENYQNYMSTQEFEYASKFLSIGRAAYEISPNSEYISILLQKMIDVSAQLDSINGKSNSLENVVE